MPPSPRPSTAVNTGTISFLQPVTRVGADTFLDSNGWSPRLASISRIDDNSMHNAAVASHPERKVGDEEKRLEPGEDAVEDEGKTSSPSEKVQMVESERMDPHIRVVLRPSSARYSFEFNKPDEPDAYKRPDTRETAPVRLWKWNSVTGSSGVASAGTGPKFHAGNAKDSDIGYHFYTKIAIHEAEAMLPCAPPCPTMLADIFQNDLPLAPKFTLAPHDCIPPPYRPLLCKLSCPTNDLLLMKHVHDEPMVLEVAKEKGDRAKHCLSLLVKTIGKLSSAFKPKVFAKRPKLSDSKALFDSGDIFAKAFDNDWKRLAATSFLQSYSADELEWLRHAISDNYELLCRVYDFYCLTGSGEPFSMQAIGYRAMLKDCGLMQDFDSPSSVEARMAFIYANRDSETGNDNAKIENVDEANTRLNMMRFEFMDVVIRLAKAKYPSILTAIAVNKLCKCDISPNMGPEVLLSTNLWRKFRLYVDDVDHCLQGHYGRLLSIFQDWSTSNYVFNSKSGKFKFESTADTPSIKTHVKEPQQQQQQQQHSAGSKSHVRRGGGRSKHNRSGHKKSGHASSSSGMRQNHRHILTPLMTLENFIELLKKSRLIGENWQISVKDARWIFCHSKTRAADELSNRRLVTHMNICDFLESLCRLAEIIILPSLTPDFYDISTCASKDAYSSRLEQFAKIEGSEDSAERLSVFWDVEKIRAPQNPSFSVKLEAFLALFLAQNSQEPFLR